VRRIIVDFEELFFYCALAIGLAVAMTDLFIWRP
jgi:hypothetical protein